MKTIQRAALTAAVIAIGALAPSLCPAQTQKNSVSRIPELPVGIMSAFPTIVQTGTKPTLNWNIMHPSRVSDLATINPPGTLIPNQTVYVTVQPIGTGITACEPGKDATEYYTDARVSYNGGAYQQVFYGVMSDIDPAHKLYIKKVDAFQTIDLGGRYVKNNLWTPFFTTRSANMQVVALVDGDIPPTTFPLYQSLKFKSYLKPYFDSSGRVRVGPLSMLFMMEMGTTNRSLNCYDYQDQVLLVTLSLKHPNNGHGNNLDGVDSSNPGQGQGGPTGLNNSGLDPSAGVDDEIR